jgi:hypothetical protein
MDAHGGALVSPGEHGGALVSPANVTKARMNTNVRAEPSLLRLFMFSPNVVDWDSVFFDVNKDKP